LKFKFKKKTRHYWKPHLLFLFSDVILLSRPSSWDLVFKSTDIRYKITWKSDLADLSIDEVSDNQDKELTNAIIIKAPVKSFYVRFNTLTELNDSINLINDAIIEAKKKLRSRNLRTSTTLPAAVWVPDEFQDRCSLCNSSFTFLNRKHHCRKCGSLVCSNCSSKKMIISEISTTYFLKVCTKCWENRFLTP